MMDCWECIDISEDLDLMDMDLVDENEEIVAAAEHEEIVTAAEDEEVVADIGIGDIGDGEREPDPEDENDLPESYNSELNPLLIPNIISNIMDNLPITELKIIRNVCHAWNEEACRLIEKRAVITFTAASDIETYMTKLEHTSNSDKLRSPVHVNYQMYGLQFDRGNEKLMPWLLTHGHRVRTLILQERVQEEELHLILHVFLTNLETLWLRYVPSLPPNTVYGRLPRWDGEYSFLSIKHFTIGTRSLGRRAPTRRLFPFHAPLPMHFPENNFIPPEFQDQDQDQVVPALPLHYVHVDAHQNSNDTEAALVKLLSSFPMLQTLTCSTIDGSCDADVSLNILRAFLHVPPENLGHFEQFNLPLHVTEDTLTYLNTLHLSNLIGASLVFGNDVRISTAKQFVQKFVPNLETFEIEFEHPRFNTCFAQPGQEMTKMKRLTLKKFGGSLSFLERMNMSSLQYFTCIDMNLSTLSTCFKHELNVMKGIKILETNVLGRDIQVLPKLGVLHLSHVNDENLYTIYANLPYLTDLACVGGGFTDMGITGIAGEILDDLSYSTRYWVVNPDKYRQDLFIANLTRLTKLRLESDEMTDLSVLCGIVKCSQIQHLHLQSSKISDLALQSIGEEMDGTLKQLNILSCPNVTETGKSIVKSCISGLEICSRLDCSLESNLVRTVTRNHMENELRTSINQRLSRLNNGPRLPELEYNY